MDILATLARRTLKEGKPDHSKLSINLGEVHLTDQIILCCWGWFMFKNRRWSVVANVPEGLRADIGEWFENLFYIK